MKTQVLPLQGKSNTFENILSTIIEEVDLVEEIHVKDGFLFMKDYYHDKPFKVGSIPSNINNLIEAGRLKIKSWKITGDIEKRNNLGLILNFE